jgi:hypothetical protein
MRAGPRKGRGKPGKEAAMSEMASLRVASLLASRLCHDLIGPLGRWIMVSSS